MFNWWWMCGIFWFIYSESRLSRLVINDLSKRRRRCAKQEITMCRRRGDQEGGEHSINNLRLQYLSSIYITWVLLHDTYCSTFTWLKTFFSKWSYSIKILKFDLSVSIYGQVIRCQIKWESCNEFCKYRFVENSYYKPQVCLVIYVCHLSTWTLNCHLNGDIIDGNFYYYAAYFITHKMSNNCLFGRGIVDRQTVSWLMTVLLSPHVNLSFPGLRDFNMLPVSH